jgi:RNA polymerase sigma-70 factor (ECF subfamily)
VPVAPRAEGEYSTSRTAADANGVARRAHTAADCGTADRGAADGELFARLFQGDNDALAQLFTRHNQRIYLYCLKIVGDGCEAEDITQRTWERLLRMRAATAADADHHVGLLLVIARNLCRDHLRSARRFDPLDLLVERLHPQANHAEHFQLGDFVANALARLPGSYREVMELHEYSGYSYDEIAVMLGQKVTAVRMRASRARACLARIADGMLALEDGKRME